VEHEVGSIAAGKRADFCVLADDPYELGPERLKDVRIAGTIFEGTQAPAVRPAGQPAGGPACATQGGPPRPAVSPGGTLRVPLRDWCEVGSELAAVAARHLKHAGANP
jgi:hypothetical protein